MSGSVRYQGLLSGFTAMREGAGRGGDAGAMIAGHTGIPGEDRLRQAQGLLKTAILRRGQ
jgi:hypothetical protein